VIEVRRWRAAGPGDAAPQRWAALGAGELVWLSLVPCLLVLVVAIAVLGGPLGKILFPSSVAGMTFYPRWLRDGSVRPEPTEHARYLLAVAAPFALSAAIALATRRSRDTPPHTRAMVWATQALALVFLIACLQVQRAVAYGSVYLFTPPRHRAYFSWPATIVAVMLTGLFVLLQRRLGLLDRVAAALRETRRLRLLASACAVGFTADWLLTALNTEGTIGAAHRGVRVSITFWLDETFAVLDGRAPMVDFHSQYSQLWPYLAAAPMAVLGTSTGVYVSTLVLGSALCLLAVYAMLRRVTRSSAAALALYLPVLATGFFMELGPLGNRYGPSNLLSEFPMRYGGPYALAWLTARHVDGARPRHRTLLFLCAGIVAINNAEFGLPALVAILAALLWTGGRPTPRSVLLLARDAFAGLAGAALLVSLLTLVVAGSLPDVGSLFFFARLYGVAGFGMLPMPAAGFHLVVYATFAGALLLATVRAVSGHEDPLLTAMLAWSGTFGLGVGGYFVGRSHPEVLIDLFSVWSLALALLVVATVRDLRRRSRGRPSPAQVAVLGAFALAICSLAQTPTPWSQLTRLSRMTHAPLLRDAEAERFVAAGTRPGEHVAILTTLGHRIAYDLQLVNVSPYASIESMPTVEQLDETIERLRAAGGKHLFVDYNITVDEVLERIWRAGFVSQRYSRHAVIQYVDTGRRRRGS
jgi:hypothetical protein